MTKFLASVRDLNEVNIVLKNGADIIDLKEPANGALGAVELTVLKQAVDDVHGRRPVSATIGNLSMAAYPVQKAVSERFSAGVDYVKIGFFPEGDVQGTLAALAREADADHALVGVLFADLNPRLALLPLLADSGFRGVMLDTARKNSGALSRHVSRIFLSNFINMAHALGMFCGLAGSLRRYDILSLLSLKPEYLGFRGALCREGRASPIDEALTREVCALMTHRAL